MKYSYSTNEEEYEGEYDRPEAAAIDGFHENEEAEVIWVGENSQPLLEDLIDSEDWFSHQTECRDEEFGGEHTERWIGDFFDKTNKPKFEELDALLSAVVKEWANRHDLQPTFWNVSNVKKFHREDFAKELATPTP